VKPVLGLLGGIGSGKSLAGRWLGAKGGRIIDADTLGHEALAQPDLQAAIVKQFGPGIVGDQGEIQRRALGQLVFADEAKLRRLERIVFPYIARRIREKIQAAQQDTAVRFVVLDAAVMLEAGWNDTVDKLLFIDAPRALRLERLQKNRGWTEADLLARERLQLPVEEKKRRADAVIVNDGDPKKVHEQLEDVLKKWKLVEC
jgi:dephospho-CoA kinase